jgi:hypothetical protein
VFDVSFLLWQTKSTFSLPWTYGKCPVDCCWSSASFELLKSALMENKFQSESFLISQPTPHLFFSPLFIVIFLSKGLVCYPLNHENHCLPEKQRDRDLTKCSFEIELMVFICRRSDLICGERRIFRPFMRREVMSI